MNSQNHQKPSVKNLFKDELPQLPKWKRAIDLFCCLIALPFLCVIAGLMAIFLRFTSRGPILFKQERVGYKGSRFMCYKFRTMVVGADTKSHQAYCDNLLGSRAPMPMVKLDSKGDSRVIPFGWLLRATGLDELPQIINIFRREMTVVGPRPCIQYEYDKYEPAQRKRFNAVPGLTGLWQVSGKNRTTFDEMIELDVRYSESSSLRLDLKIILMTVPALIVQVADTRLARKSLVRPNRMPAPSHSVSTSSKHSPQPISS
jgi:lipopolysaccharide/colanic/teichoic acid biosynthesis glycosyltransferase